MELPWESKGASGMGTSRLPGSDFMGSGVEELEAVETLRRGVGVEVALGSFFL